MFETRLPIVPKTTLTTYRVKKVRKQLRNIFLQHIKNNNTVAFTFIANNNPVYGYIVVLAFKKDVTLEQQNNCIEQFVSLFKSVEYVNNVIVTRVHSFNYNITVAY